MRKKHKKTIEEIREDALRPSRYLGYDRDSIGRHLLYRGAPELAETQFRRAVWLNPYEPAFKEHLAICLYRERSVDEARQWAEETLEQRPDSPEARKVLDLIAAMNSREGQGQERTS